MILKRFWDDFAIVIEAFWNPMCPKVAAVQMGCGRTCFSHIDGRKKPRTARIAKNAKNRPVTGLLPRIAELQRMGRRWSPPRGVFK